MSAWEWVTLVLAGVAWLLFLVGTSNPRGGERVLAAAMASLVAMFAAGIAAQVV